MNVLLALITGHLLVVLFPDFGFTLLAPFALVPLLVALTREPVWWKRLLLGELAGFIQWIGWCYWIRQVLEAYGGVPATISWLALVLFAVVKGLHLAAFSVLSGWVLNRWWAIPAVAALWTGLERTHGPLGFAWLTLGNAGAEMSVPLRLAPLVGVYGLSFLFAAINAGVALLVLRRPRPQLAWLLAVPLLFLLPELPPLEPGVRQAVAVQPNLDEGQPLPLDRLSALTRIRSLNLPALVVWPELPTGMFWDEDPVFRRSMQELARSIEAPLLFGGVTYTDDGRPLNTALTLDASGREAGRYSKTYLVPFGEFVPPFFQWIGKVSDQAGDFVPGAGPAIVPTPAGRLGAFICYEAAFPHLVRQFTAAGADVLVNISNDGWFFRTSARAQHLQLARMRAVENRRWLIRATNNGITAAIDPAGRVVARLREFQETAGSLPYSTVTELTPYARYGDWFAWLCLTLGIGTSLIGARKSGRSRSHTPDRGTLAP